MNPKVYVETTIPSFYYEDRTNAEAIARKEWTRNGIVNILPMQTNFVTLDKLMSCWDYLYHY